MYDWNRFYRLISESQQWNVKQWNERVDVTVITVCTYYSLWMSTARYKLMGDDYMKLFVRLLDSQLSGETRH